MNTVRVFIRPSDRPSVQAMGVVVLPWRSRGSLVGILWGLRGAPVEAVGGSWISRGGRGDRGSCDGPWMARGWSVGSGELPWGLWVARGWFLSKESYCKNK